MSTNLNQTQNLADLIKAFRQRSNMTQTEFAKASGYYQAQVSQLETGHLFDLRASEVVSLARLLGLEINVVWNALLNSILLGSAPDAGGSPQGSNSGMPVLRTDGRRGAIDNRGKRKPPIVVIPVDDGTGQRGIVGGDGHVRVVNAPDPMQAAEANLNRAFQVRGLGSSESLGDKPAAFQFKGVQAVPIPLDDIPYDDGLEEVDPNGEFARQEIPVQGTAAEIANRERRKLTAADFSPGAGSSTGNGNGDGNGNGNESPGLNSGFGGGSLPST